MVHFLLAVYAINLMTLGFCRLCVFCKVYVENCKEERTKIQKIGLKFLGFPGKLPGKQERKINLSVYFGEYRQICIIERYEIVEYVQIGLDGF